MRLHFILLLLPVVLSCDNVVNPNFESAMEKNLFVPSNTIGKPGLSSWQNFLQQLPIIDKPIVDYRGREISNQAKHAGIINYDVGNSDLQQCADALIRLRAEYLFQQKRFNEIGFHFVSGNYYTWNDYCKGLRPVVTSDVVRFVKSASSGYGHESLRKYLDIVYSYASTISLSKELKETDDFEIGTVVIQAGSPGHCLIITDVAINKANEKVYKLVEGYMSAQSIYVLRNLSEPGISPWYKLGKDVIETASYRFDNYKLGKFE